MLGLSFSRVIVEHNLVGPNHVSKGCVLGSYESKKIVKEARGHQTQAYCCKNHGLNGLGTEPPVNNWRALNQWAPEIVSSGGYHWCAPHGLCTVAPPSCIIMIWLLLFVFCVFQKLTTLILGIKAPFATS